jgi:hypothetical protein
MNSPRRKNHILAGLLGSAIVTALTAGDRLVCAVRGHRWDNKAAPYRHCFRCHKYEAREWLPPRRKGGE